MKIAPIFPAVIAIPYPKLLTQVGYNSAV